MKKKILVVDDERDIRFLLEEFLTGAGYNVVAVENGQIAAGWIAKNPIDLVLTDFSMPPGVNGDTVARLARKQDIPVIIMTGKPWEIPSDHVADEVIEKPFSLEELQKTIADLLV